MEILIPVGLIIGGWLLGCLVNYLADVLPVTRRLSAAPCGACQHPRGWVDLLLVRRCQNCHQKRSLRVWIVQAAAVIITLAQWYFPSTRLGFWVGLPLLVYFAVVAIVDIEHRLILHMVSAFGAVLGATVGIWLHGLASTLLGGLAGLGMMGFLYLLGWGVGWIFGKLRGSAIEEDPMGFGDIMLGAVLGLILGWPGITAGIVFTIFIAGAGSLIILLVQLLRRKYEPFAAVAFGPYMILAAIYLLYRP